MLEQASSSIKSEEVHVCAAKLSGAVSEESVMRRYERRNNELSLQDGCVVWSSRVVIWPSLRERIAKELYKTHPGMAWMKAVARQYVWWPDLDAELEAKVKTCTVFQVHNYLPEWAPLHPWEWPQNHGPGYMQTSQAPLYGRCSWGWWMRTLNGSTFTSQHRHQLMQTCRR